MTAQILPPYTGDSACCVKCGNDALTPASIATGYGEVPDIEKIKAAQRGNPFGIIFGGDVQQQEPELPPMLRGYSPGQEFLARQCGRCGYAWLEACLDDPNLAFKQDL